ncbi:MAG: hypothetical protein KKA90_04650 [Nanoarchaeota archaeon]|nr:hypothetical protein [Nanoarchaeota archaeon]
MSSFEILATRFDVRKLDKICNAKDCTSLPAKEIVLYELEHRTFKKRELASIFLCAVHAALMPEVMNEIRKDAPEDRSIERKGYDLVYQ